jgi:hypothetical protein
MAHNSRCSTPNEAEGGPHMGMIHIRQLAATHRLKIGIVEDGWREVALAAIHFMEFCAGKAAIGLGGVHAHDTAPLVDQALLSIEASRAIHLLVRPHWRNVLAAAVKRFTGCTQIGNFVMAITGR